jgi:hypothetical protein
MNRHGSMREAMLDRRVVRVLGDALLDTDPLAPWRKVRADLKTLRERRGEELKAYSFKQVARAAGAGTQPIFQKQRPDHGSCSLERRIRAVILDRRGPQLGWNGGINDSDDRQ